MYSYIYVSGITAHQFLSAIETAAIIATTFAKVMNKSLKGNGIPSAVHII